MSRFNPSANSKELKNLSLMNFTKYGEIVLPSDFLHNLDFQLWRNADGKIEHNFDFDSRISNYTTYYISNTGANANDGLTASTPLSTMDYLINKVEADANVSSAKIVIVGNVLGKDNGFIDKKTITKNYAIVPQNPSAPCYVGNFQKNLVWTQYATGVYSAPRSQVGAVFDTKYKAAYNLPYELTKVNTLSECVSKKGTWYTDNTLVYVHRKDESTINNNEVLVAVNSMIWQPIFNSDSSFMARDITFVNGGLSAPLHFTSTTASKGNVIMKNIKLTGSFGTVPNGISTDGVKSIWLFDCLVKDIARDGYNYHNTLDGNTFVLEYNCMAFNCGVNDENGNNNATTAHEGIRILRIGTKGWNTKGPLCADVNGCYTIAIDCTMHDSLLSNGYSAKTAYWFDDNVSGINPNPNGKAILINCSGGGGDTFSINCGDSFKAGKITLENFKGKNVPQDIKFNVLK